MQDQATLLSRCTPSVEAFTSVTAHEGRSLQSSMNRDSLESTARCVFEQHDGPRLTYSRRSCCKVHELHVLGALGSRVITACEDKTLQH